MTGLAWVAGTVVVLIVLAYLIALAIFARIAAVDRAGLFPRNDIRELNREDGGPGPI